MGIDLMSVDRSSLQALGGKPRPANDSEVSAYMRWQRERRGLPAMEGMELEWRTYPGSRGQRLCIGATFGKKVQERRQITPPRWEGGTYFPGEYQTELWENGAYSLVMPGHNAHKQAVTFESLDDAGNVERAQTLPMEPKKGGVIWSRDDVRKAHGPVEKVRKPRASKAPIPVEATPIPVRAADGIAARDGWRFERGAWPTRQAGNRDLYLKHECGASAAIWPNAARGGFSVHVPGSPPVHGFETRRAAFSFIRKHAIADCLADPVEICPPEPAESDSGPCVVAEAPEAPEALCEAVSGQDEPVTIADKLLAPEAVKDSLTTDPVAVLLARVEALEAIVAALSAETGADAVKGEKIELTPIPAVQDHPKRSAAHERAIRRAWAERKARRDMLQTLTVAAANQASSNGEIMRLRDECTSWKRIAAERLTFLHRSQDKRRRAVLALREMRGRAAHYYANWKEEARRCGEADHAATFERQRAAVLAAQLAKAQEDLAGAYSETELQAAVAVERERAASLRAELEAARAEGEGRADGAGVAAAQAAAQMARAIAAEEAVAAVRADLDKERAALAAVTARNARLLQSMADLTERVERAEAAIAA